MRSFPPEVWTHIVETIDLDSDNRGKGLATLAQTCKGLRDLVLPYLYCLVTHNDLISSKLLTTLRSAPHLASLIKGIEITASVDTFGSTLESHQAAANIMHASFLCRSSVETVKFTYIRGGQQYVSSRDLSSQFLFGPAVQRSLADWPKFRLLTLNTTPTPTSYTALMSAMLTVQPGFILELLDDDYQARFRVSRQPSISILRETDIDDLELLAHFLRQHNLEQVDLLVNDIEAVSSGLRPEDLSRLRNVRFCLSGEQSHRDAGDMLGSLDELRRLELRGLPLDPGTVRPLRLPQTLTACRPNLCSFTFDTHCITPETIRWESFLDFAKLEIVRCICTSQEILQAVLQNQPKADLLYTNRLRPQLSIHLLSIGKDASPVLKYTFSEDGWTSAERSEACRYG